MFYVSNIKGTSFSGDPRKKDDLPFTDMKEAEDFAMYKSTKSPKDIWVLAESNDIPFKAWFRGHPLLVETSIGLFKDFRFIVNS